MRGKNWMTGKELEAALIRLQLSWTAAATVLDISYRQLLKMRRGERPIEKQTRDLLRCWLDHGRPAEEVQPSAKAGTSRPGGKS